MFGACAGSFLNVCILRIPQGKSIVRPPSSCACGKLIAWYDNIPVLSWFLLRGKARCCGRKFSFRYPAIELLTAACFLILALEMPLQNAIVGAVFISLMIAASFIDIDNLCLPDSITVGGAAAGLVISIALPATQGVSLDELPYIAAAMKGGILSILGMAVGSGVLYWMRLGAQYAFRREAMGEGDVVLLGCIGAFCGWQGALFAIFGGSLIGSILILPILAIRKLFGVKPKAKPLADDEENSEGMIPFGPWLCLGGALYYMFLSNFIDGYFGGFSTALFGI